MVPGSVLRGLLVVLLVWPLAGCSDEPFAQGLMFRVEKAGQRPSHVFAATASTDRRVLDLPAAVTAVLETADRLVLQTGYTDVISTRDYVVDHLVLRNGQQLSNLIGRKAFRRLVAIGKRYRLTEQGLSALKPVAVVILIAPTETEARRRLNDLPSQTQTLEARAQAMDIPIFALMTVPEQLRDLAGLNDEQQTRLLMQALDDIESSEAGDEKNVELYLNRDLEGLLDSAQNGAEEVDDVARTDRFVELLDERNRTLIERMEVHLEAGNAFIALGAAHLAGESGVLRLLERDGYHVTRVE